MRRSRMGTQITTWDELRAELETCEITLRGLEDLLIAPELPDALIETIIAKQTAWQISRSYLRKLSRAWIARSLGIEWEEPTPPEDDPLDLRVRMAGVRIPQ
jgi:hypothetical protein